MPIIAVGLNYRTASVELREQFAISDQILPNLLERMMTLGSVLECVILATCNRTEIYADVPSSREFVRELSSFIELEFGLPQSAFVPYLAVYEQGEAVTHLLQVTSGLDSLVIGETQILGQVKEAFAIARRTGTTSAKLNKLFQQAVTLAKRAHAHTKINDHPVSVSYAAVELAKQITGNLQRQSVVMIGAGKMSELAVKHLQASGVSDIMVVNRTFERAAELASKIGGSAHPMADLAACLETADIVISSTGSSDYVLDMPTYQEVQLRRQGRPVVMIDLAVPRDIDPEIGKYPNTSLYNIDDLTLLVDQNLNARMQEAERIQVMIEQEAELFARWLRTERIHPLLSALQQKAIRIQEEAMQSMLNRLPHMDEHEIKVMRKLTKSIASQLIREPMLTMKQLAEEGKAEEAAALFSQLYGLPSDLTVSELESDNEANANADKETLRGIEGQQEHKRKHLTVVTGLVSSRVERIG